MYNSLLFAVKRKILDEVEGAFATHPAFSEKVTVRNKFPYEERLQYGVVIRNASASTIRLSPDNFMSDLFSLCTIFTDPGYPGTTVEWVRENQGNVTIEVTEDVSTQFDGTIRVFHTDFPILQGEGNTEYADSPGQVTVKLNGDPVQAEYVSGGDNEVWLSRAPQASDVISITYCKRAIVHPGLFTIDLIEEKKFTVSAVYIIENEVVIERTTGIESEVSLAYGNIEAGSDDIVLGYTDNQGRIESMERTVDYNIDLTDGKISFLKPLMKNYAIYADYRYTPPNYPPGPWTFEEYKENTLAIPGVVISIGRRYQQGDQQIVRVSQTREQQAKIYGGHWEMSLDLGVISKDPMQMEQMTDRIVEYLWGVRKNVLENEGLTFNAVEPTGEAEEVHIDVTGDLYYESSVSINVMSEWQLFEPYRPYLKIKNIVVIPSLIPVFKGPIVGYERLT